MKEEEISQHFVSILALFADEGKRFYKIYRQY